MKLEDKVEIFQKAKQKDQGWENIGHIEYQPRRSNMWLINVPERENQGKGKREIVLELKNTNL